MHPLSLAAREFTANSQTAVQSGLSCAARVLQGVSRNLCVSGHGPAARKEETMKRLFVGIATAALMSGGVVAAALGAGAAQADDCAPSAMVNGICYGPNQWCPGDSLLTLTQITFTTR